MNKPVISKRMKDVEESATLQLNALAQKLKREGKDIINLTAGEPDFPAPAEAKEAVIQALQNEWSKYTPTAGIPELREKVAKVTNRSQPSLQSKHVWSGSEVVLTNGGKQAIFDVVMCLVDSGDEAIIPAPYWVSYPEMVRIADGTAVVIETGFENDFKITPSQLEKAITSKTKIIFLNSPSNPTGTVYSREEYQALGRVLEKHPQIWILSDEIYELIQYGHNPGVSFLEACPGLWSRTVTLNGLSKSGSMTGWRIGWSVADAKLTQKLIALQGHSTSGISSLSQAAALATLDLPSAYFEQHRQEFERRRDLALACLSNSAKIKVFAPRGAFYVWIQVQDVLKDDKDGIKEDAQKLASRCLQEAQVAVVPGNSFGANNFIRISFACKSEVLQEACNRLVQFFNS